MMTSPASAFESVNFSPDCLDDERVHEIRKATKQIRAHLSLLQALQGKSHEQEKLRNAARHLARLLCPLRDHSVMSAAVESMAAESMKPELARLLTIVRDGIENQALSTSEAELARELARAIAGMAPRLLHTNFDAGILDQFLRSALAALTEIGPKLLAAQDFDDLHNWRKQVKALMYQYQLKQSPTAKDLQLIELLDQLGHSLGNVNDMHILKNYLLREQKQNNTFAPALVLVDNKASEELANARAAFDRLRDLANCL